MSEPLSKLKPPPDIATAATTTTTTDPPVIYPTAALGEKREWVIVDYDIRNMPGNEVFLPGLWKRMHDDGTFGMFFHEGPEMNFWQFVAMLSSPERRVQLIIGHDEAGTAKEHAGMLILDHVYQTDVVKRAVGNFVFFDEYWNHGATMEIGRTVLNHWFGVMDFDVIAGLTPRANRAAISFIKRLGFQIVGDVPGFTVYDGKLSATATSFMTRKMWQDRKEKVAN